MRVITGTARGTNLVTLEGESTRPTTDRVKEAIFSMIQFEVEGRKVLDLFAGSGQLALEALSRGAEKATLIDENRAAVDVIIENAKKTHLFEKCRISASDYASFLLSNAGKEKYDIVFLDPPYASDFLPKALKKLAASDLLNPGALVVCESDTPEAARSFKAHKKHPEAEEMAMKETVFANSEELASIYSVRKNVTYGRVRVTLLTFGGEHEDE